jgi:lipoprotein signal peptidase
VADCFLVCGTILLMIYILFFDKPQKKEETSHDSDG